MEAERENKLHHVFKSTTARETSIERGRNKAKREGVGGRTLDGGREETDVEEKLAPGETGRDGEEKEGHVETQGNADERYKRSRRQSGGLSERADASCG